ncbi:MAG TPA: OmpH family outer membrane protein, partial [Gemmatimonadales bacterium]
GAALGIGPAAAQQPQQASGAPAKIAFVNARSALQAMPGYAKAESTFVKEGEATQGELRRLQAQLDSALAQFQQQEPMLSATNRATRRKELETKNEQLQTRARDLQQKLALRERELLQPMQERLTAIIEGIRAESNFAMIIDLGAQGLGIVTYDKSLDITPRVIQRLRQTN